VVRPRLEPWARSAAARFDLALTTRELVAEILRSVFPTYIDDPAFVGLLETSVAQNLDALTAWLSEGSPSADIRPQPAMFARAQAEMRIAQTTLQRSYRVGFLRLWTLWSDQLVAEGERRALDAPRLVEAIQTLGTLIFAFQDFALSAVADEYSVVNDALRVSRDHLRQALVSQLLSGTDHPLPARELFLTLRYDVADAHLGVQVATGDAKRLDRIVDVVRRRCAARSLDFETDDGRHVTWIGRPSSWPASQLEVLENELRAADIGALLSTAAIGLAGFRQTFTEIQRMRQVQELLGARAPTIVRYADVRLESMFAHDVEEARRFATAELGDLAADDPQMITLRETVRVWLDMSSNVAAAEVLGVHEQTVRYRLRRSEELLGRSLRDRRTETLIALRLLDLMGR
jgi:DNA-binding PucR family transcriptional regulator